MLCHSPWVEKRTTIYGIQSASPLGVNTPQLNRPFDKGANAPNQLESWHKLGLLAWTPELGKLPKLVDPYDESADLDRRARSYLQTNCAHCHQFGSGGSANIELRYDLPLDKTKTIASAADPGDFQYLRSQDHRSRRPGRARCCIIESPSWEAAACRASDRSRLTSVRSA